MKDFLNESGAAKAMRATGTPLNPEDYEEIHPHAQKRYKEWEADIEQEIAALKLTDKDFDTYLSDDEKARFEGHLKEIKKWLFTCRGIVEGYSLLPYSLGVIDHMHETKSLLLKVAERKQQKEQRWSAFKELNPPLQDAKRWLNPDDYQEFEKSIAGAISAHLQLGRNYIGDKRAWPYLAWIRRIEVREEAEKTKQNAASKAGEFNHSLDNEISSLKARLRPQKQSPEEYFKKESNDRRYLGYSFAYLLPIGDKESCDAIIKQKVQKMIPVQFSRFIHIRYQTAYFLLPLAEYSLEDIPCLDFSFDIFAVVEAGVWAKPATATIDGYVFDLPWVEHKCGPSGSYYVLLKEPQFLGYRYLLLTPAELGSTFWHTIPLLLVGGSLCGELEPWGITITGASCDNTTYDVDGYDEEVTIPADFTEYLQKIGGIDQMTKAGIIPGKVAGIIQRRLTQPLSRQREIGQETPPLAGTRMAFSNEEFISSLTALGIPKKDSERLLELTPRNIALSEATKLALQKHSEIIALRKSENST